MTAAAGVASVLVDFAKWAIDTGRAELAREILAYWRSRNFGPIPPNLERWTDYDAETDAELSARERGQRGT